MLLCHKEDGHGNPLALRPSTLEKNFEELKQDLEEISPTTTTSTRTHVLNWKPSTPPLPTCNRRKEDSSAQAHRLRHGIKIARFSQLPNDFTWEEIRRLLIELEIAQTGSLCSIKVRISRASVTVSTPEISIRRTPFTSLISHLKGSRCKYVKTLPNAGL